MKKLLAMLLALVMALSCAGAIAEEPATEENGFALPAFTLAFESTVNADALAALLPVFGVDENTAALAQIILPLLANTNGQIVFADNGVQFDLGLKGQTVLSAAAELTEDGVAIASDILPSYVLTLSKETVEEILKQFTAQSEEALSSVNMEAVLESLTGYAMQYSATIIGAVKFGDPEMGEYAFEKLELTYNYRMPVEIDMEAIKGAVLTLMEQIKNDENFASLFSALEAMGVSVDMSEEPEFIVPEVTVYVYGNVDAEGNTVEGDTFVDVETVATAEGQTVTVNVGVLVKHGTVTVFVDMPEQDVSMTVYVEPAASGAFISFSMSAAGIKAAETLEISLGEVVKLYSESFLMDMENAISTDLVTFAQGGERTFAVQDENKTAVTLEQLMADSEGEISGALLADVMSNGLGALIAKVSEIMPEEVANVMMLFYPAEAVEGAAE